MNDKTYTHEYVTKLLDAANNLRVYREGTEEYREGEAVVEQYVQEWVMNMEEQNKYAVNNIDWEDKGSYISDNFTVHEATWLPSLRIYHQPSYQEKTNILKMAQKMELIRTVFDKPIIVHGWGRPTYVNCPGSEYHGIDYNAYVGSTADESAHITFQAVDYHVAGMGAVNGCAKVRAALLPRLEEFGIRMEDLTSAWVHNDNYPVKHKRFFKP